MHNNIINEIKISPCLHSQSYSVSLFLYYISWSIVVSLFTATLVVAIDALVVDKSSESLRN